jgi:glycosyltransferase involved in cell wall biosynthesis
MNEASLPLVSVVVPIYNGDRFLDQAVRSCVDQTYPHVEVILVDDGSSDGSRAMADRLAAEHPAVRCLHHEENQGVSVAWNTGFSAAKGALFLRLAQDDYFEPGALEKLVALAVKTPEAGAFYADCWVIRTDGERETEFTPSPQELFRSSNRIGLCVMLRAEVWSRGVRYDPEFRAAEDLDFFTRLRERGVLFAKCDGEPLLNVLLHSDSGTIRMSVRQELETAKIILRSSLMGCATKRRFVAQNYANAVYILRKQNKTSEARTVCREGMLQVPFSAKLWVALISVLVVRSD